MLNDDKTPNPDATSAAVLPPVTHSTESADQNGDSTDVRHNQEKFLQRIRMKQASQERQLREMLETQQTMKEILMRSQNGGVGDDSLTRGGRDDTPLTGEGKLVELLSSLPDRIAERLGSASSAGSDERAWEALEKAHPDVANRLRDILDEVTLEVDEDSTMTLGDKERASSIRTLFNHRVRMEEAKVKRDRTVSDGSDRNAPVGRPKGAKAAAGGAGTQPNKKSENAVFKIWRPD